MMLPDYAGLPVSLRPPFQFANVMVNVFPLRAQLDSLQRFCDSFLNHVIPPQVGHFRVPVPYVLLMLLDYGKLAAQVTNLGWFAQREVLFSVPIEWYKPSEGRWVFYDWVSIAPFIYVDSEMSMTLGRTAMGWAKSIANLQPQLTGWMRDPAGAMVDVALSARVFTKAFTGARMEEQTLMLIRSMGTSSTHFPYEASGPLNPWTMWSTMARSAVDLSSDFMSSLQGMGIFPPHAGSTSENQERKLRRARELSWQSLPWGPSLTSGTLNLKQFRLADDPRQYCYQALTLSPLRFTVFSRGGFLGSALRGPSGGYTIDISCWPTFPVVDALGIEAETIKSSTGPDIARLTPMLPYWYEANMEYERTETLAFRTGKDWTWNFGEGFAETFIPPGAHSKEREAPRGAGLHGDGAATWSEVPPPCAYFNTATGAASPVVTGPFTFPSATLTVFPLLAERSKLNEFVDKLLNTPLAQSVERFRVWQDHNATTHSYVYLTVFDGSTVSKTYNIGDWGDLALTFYVPVQRLRGDEVIGCGLFPVYSFASGTTHACTMSELYGVPVIEATLKKVAASLSDITMSTSRSLLRLDAESLTALHQGQSAGACTLLELVDYHSGGELEKDLLSDRGEAFCRLLRHETKRKNAVSEPEKQAGRVQALGLLACDAPLYVYTLKQFRDAGAPEKACYQALVQIPYVIEEIQQLAELNHILRVELRERASFPIVDTLGLVARDVQVEEGTSVHILEAVRPFQLRATLSMGNGREHILLGGARSSQVESCTRSPERSLLEALELCEQLDQFISEEHPCHLKRWVAYWKERHLRYGQRQLTSDPGLLTVEPQVVLESILSREWEDRSSTSRRAEKHSELEGKLTPGGDWLYSNLKKLGQFHPDSDLTLVNELHRLEEAYLLLDRAHGEAELHASSDHWRTWLTKAFVVLELDEGLRSLDAGRATQARLREAYEDEMTSGPSAKLRRELGRTLRDYHQLAARRLDEAVDAAVKRSRKPDHCVLRTTACSELDRLFPLDECWSKTWWRGEDPTHPHAERPSTLPFESIPPGNGET